MKWQRSAARIAVMSSKPVLKVDWATHEAAKFACEKWHYSKTLPVGKLVKIGAWEDGKFVGVVLFAWGANRSLGSPYGLEMTQCCELVRIAMTAHKTEVSRVVSIAIKFLRKQSPGLELVVSFADPSAGHHGGIYQAGNWTYTGTCAASFEYRLNGNRLNKRAFTGNQFGKQGSRADVPAGAEKVNVPGKHRYLMPLSDATRVRISALAKPYPKRAKGQDSGHPPELGSSTLTRTLHTPAQDD